LVRAVLLVTTPWTFVNENSSLRGKDVGANMNALGRMHWLAVRAAVLGRQNRYTLPVVLTCC
jgi:hypothetical protein